MALYIDRCHGPPRSTADTIHAVAMNLTIPATIDRVLTCLFITNPPVADPQIRSW
jgi:hypothetical protein